MDPRLIEAVPVLARLAEAGHVARFVGGCVRDAVLGRPLHDVDIATSANPEAVMSLFPKHVPTGLKHGTVTVFVDGRPYEVTTFRQESAYERHRRPLEVAFISDLHGDLLRRDYTINAMAMDGSGAITDPFGGLHDIRRGVIRCVGDPDARFQEDALRMLRGVRFAAELGFRFSGSTWRAIRQHRQLLRHIAMERVGAELDKMIGGADPDRAAGLLIRSGLLLETAEPLSAGALPVCTRLHRLSALPPGDARWAAVWLAAQLPPDDSRRWMDRFALGSARLRAIFAIVRLHGALAQAVEPLDRRQWIGLVLHYGRSAAHDLLAIMRALPELQPTAVSEPDRLADWVEAMPVTAMRELAIGGADLAALSGKRKPGAWMKETLAALLLAAAAGEIANERTVLLDEARRQLARNPDR